MLFSRKIARAFLTDSTLTDFRQIVEEAKYQNRIERFWMPSSYMARV